MKGFKCIISFVVLVLSCINLLSCISDNTTEISTIKLQDVDSSFVKLEDSLYAKTTYNDSTQLGELIIYKLNKRGELIQIQHIDSLQANYVFGIDTFADFNNDGLKDLLIVHGFGARGGNKLNYLFLRKFHPDSFLYINGSDFAPNLNFNKERNVIESMVLRGTTTFDDYKVDADSLKLIYSVDVSYDSPFVIREYYEIENGERRIVRIDSVKDNVDGIFSREP